ncbi:response regulator [Ulvibacterium sp.]|uniref:LytR/AlgR family response regulator transcription factor n=1 Tax=Ulvibacterium sp. TaxID=2665914 RepID=UPI002620900C|nr:response regulator [Ulvibacterium sp.]
MSLNIIVIDDSPMQLLMSTNLIQQNRQLNLLGAFTNPFLGLKAINAMDVDIVLLDVEMPEIDGFSLKKLLGDPIKVIMYSSRSLFEFQAYAQGAIDFIHKPLNTERLDNSVAKVLQEEIASQHQEKEFSALAS